MKGKDVLLDVGDEFIETFDKDIMTPEEIKKLESITEFAYPNVDDILRANKLVLDFHKPTRAEKHELIKDKDAIKKMIGKIKTKKGGVFLKASMLLKDINRNHYFGSANKRTSFVIASGFILKNIGYIIQPPERERKFMYEVREGKRTTKQIEEFLLNYNLEHKVKNKSWANVFSEVIENNKAFLRKLG